MDWRTFVGPRTTDKDGKTHVVKTQSQIKDKVKRERKKRKK